MTIGDFLIKNVRTGNLPTTNTSEVIGMDEIWTFHPDKKYQPGILVNNVSGTILGTVELFDRDIDDSWRT
jgi:hypothetical protein